MPQLAHPNRPEPLQTSRASSSAQALEVPLALPKLGRPESHGRSFAKAVTWRAVGTADTFLWSWLITGEAVSAGTIALTEIFTKIVIYYLHERLWRVVRWAPNARVRSLVKAVSWRFVGGLDTFVLSLVITRSAHYTVSIASVEALTKIALYYLHERAWRRVAWGRLDG
ncbi:MAG: hypothetical protein JWQ97_2908 [Phenylobacterium sp.]|nr:hypothetical protein [Phenylobacterium sp.]